MSLLIDKCRNNNIEELNEYFNNTKKRFYLHHMDECLEYAIDNLNDELLKLLISKNLKKYNKEFFNKLNKNFRSSIFYDNLDITKIAYNEGYRDPRMFAICCWADKEDFVDFFLNDYSSYTKKYVLEGLYNASIRDNLNIVKKIINNYYINKYKINNCFSYALFYEALDVVDFFLDKYNDKLDFFKALIFCHEKGSKNQISYLLKKIQNRHITDYSYKFIPLYIRYEIYINNITETKNNRYICILKQFKFKFHCISYLTKLMNYDIAKLIIKSLALKYN